MSASRQVSRNLLVKLLPQISQALRTQCNILYILVSATLEERDYTEKERKLLEDFSKLAIEAGYKEKEK